LRLRFADAALLTGLLAAWLVCLVLHLQALTRGDLAWIPLHVAAAASAQDHPTVQGFWSGAEHDAPGLAVGDRLLAVGDHDLRGAGRLAVVARIYQQADGTDSVPVRFERAGIRGEARLDLEPIPLAWRKTLVAAGLVIVGALAFWRTRGSHVGRLFFLALVFYAFHWTDFWGGPPGRTYTAIASFGTGVALAQVLALRVALSFPEESARWGRWARTWPWLFVLTGPVIVTWAFGAPLPADLGQPLAMLGIVTFIATFLAVLARSYRECGPMGRRQIKWGVFGIWVGLFPALFTGALSLAFPRLWWLYEACLGLVIAIPISLLIALTRYNLFDINRLITAAMTYTVMSALLLASIVAVVPWASRALEGVVDPSFSQTAMALVIAVVLWPVHHRIGPAIEHRIYPERLTLEREAQQLRRALSRCEKPEELLTVLCERLQELLRLDCVVIYGRARDAFAPLFARGRAVAPAFDAEGPMIEALTLRAEPVDATRIERGRAALPHSKAELAALRTMGVEVVLPVILREELAAFVCLGEKQSGDIFTSTDRALLQSLADKTSDELLRFDHEVVYRQERAMAERLRRYVPGAVADELTSGDAALEASEQIVTVLFVDVRGYTSFSERHRAEAVFGFVNRYTEAVSRIVREHGGSVVEFNGDGMMAVFGAPQPLPRKEQAALAAARAICARVPRIEASDASLSVGVGIATGEDFVGNIRAADRYIWSAIGNTTNLAARLEGLTRVLDAAIAIDRATHEAANGVDDDFELHARQQIKGRAHPIDVYALPLDRAPVEETG
jgi:class 3 adenylate cyclase